MSVHILSQVVLILPNWTTGSDTVDKVSGLAQLVVLILPNWTTGSDKNFAHGMSIGTTVLILPNWTTGSDKLYDPSTKREWCLNPS